MNESTEEIIRGMLADGTHMREAVKILNRRLHAHALVMLEGKDGLWHILEAGRDIEHHTSFASAFDAAIGALIQRGSTARVVTSSKDVADKMRKGE